MNHQLLIEISHKEIQELALGALKSYASFCDKYYLRYFLAGGSLIGAIRNNGFISWDDEIGIRMPRRD
jgi:lipopolysaccharide cholinephosphotransferase